VGVICCVGLGVGGGGGVEACYPKPGSFPSAPSLQGYF